MQEDMDISGLHQDPVTNKEGGLRRPMNAFLIFCKKHRGIVRDKNPHLDNRAVTRILGELWAGLPTPEKESYLSLAKQYRDAFMKANPDYHWHTSKKETLPAFKPANRPGMSSMRLTLQTHANSKIVPGKLADPSNMGGLGLLLKPVNHTDAKSSATPYYGQQINTMPKEINKNSNGKTQVATPTTKSSSLFENSTALLHLAEMCTSQQPTRVNRPATVHTHPSTSKPDTFRTITSNAVQHPPATKSKSPQWISNEESFKWMHRKGQGAAAVLSHVNKQMLYSKTWSSGLPSQHKLVAATNSSNNLGAVPTVKDTPPGRIIEVRKTSSVLPHGSKLGDESVAKYLRTLETTPLPIAMPLMVNKMIETVLCKELSNDDVDKNKLSKKLECHESLDLDANEGPAVSNRSSRSVSGSCATASENKTNPILNHIDQFAKINDPALTFSQIQETLIRKAMEDSNLVAPKDTSPIKNLAQKGEIKHVKIIDKAGIMGLESQKGVSNFTQPQVPVVTQLAVRRNFPPTETLKLKKSPVLSGIQNWSKPVPKQDTVKPEMKSEKFSEFDSYKRTMSQILENSIKAELQIKSPDLKSRSSRPSLESMDLTCKEEFKDSGTEDSLVVSNPSQNTKDFDKLRYQIETQLTSHLLASAGVLSTYKDQLSKEWLNKQNIIETEDNVRQSGDIHNATTVVQSNILGSLKQGESNVRTTNLNSGIGTGKTCDSSFSTHAHTGILLPPKKRGLRYLQKDSDSTVTYNNSDLQKPYSAISNTVGPSTDDSGLSKTKTPGKNQSRDSPKTSNELEDLNLSNQTLDNSANQKSRRRRRNAAEMTLDPYGKKLSSKETRKNAGPDMVDPDEDPLDADDDESGVRKSKRRNRGQRYQELLSKGLLQVGRQKRADSTSENTELDSSNGLVRRRKRTVSETNAFLLHHDAAHSSAHNSHKLLGGFDLEAHLAQMPSCRIDNSAHDTMQKSSIRTRSRHRSGPIGPALVNTAPPRILTIATTRTRNAQVKSKVDTRNKHGRKHSNKHSRKCAAKSTDERVQSKDLNIAELRQTQLHKQGELVSTTSRHVTGSQKRKQRRCPITQLHQMSKEKVQSTLDLETNNNQNVLSTKPRCKDVTSPRLSHAHLPASQIGNGSTHTTINFNFATLLDVAVAETEKLLRQSSATQVTVSCS